MPTANKRIPITEERWVELNELKEPGQTYDELLDELVKERRKAKLMKHVNELRDEQEDFVSLDEV